jgi:sporulation protein YlmC with PRC-barrel domain
MPPPDGYLHSGSGPATDEVGADMAENGTGALGAATPGRGPAGASKSIRPGWRLSSERRDLASQLVSVSNLVGRPVRSLKGARIGRVADIVALWKTAISHPLISGVLAKVGKDTAMVPIDELNLTQAGVQISSSSLKVMVPQHEEGHVQLARDVLDHQLVDVTGVQVVRASDVYIVKTNGAWELAGVDVGAWALFRRLLPKRLCRSIPDRALDWADVQAFVPRFPEEAAGALGPASAAGTSESGVRLAYPANTLRKLRANDVARLLAGLDRGPQAQLAVMADPTAVAAAVAELGPDKFEALLSELGESDRARLKQMSAGGGH